MSVVISIGKTPYRRRRRGLPRATQTGSADRATVTARQVSEGNILRTTRFGLLGRPAGTLSCVKSLG